MRGFCSRWVSRVNSKLEWRVSTARQRRCRAIATSVMFAAGSASTIEIEHDPPVAPIVADPRTPHRWVLRTSTVSLTVDAHTAEFLALAPTGSSNLLASATVRSMVPRTERSAGWIWPVPESIWPTLRAQGHWPETIFGAPLWSGRAWRARSGAVFCRWSREFGPPIFARATRTVRVSPYAASIEIEDRWERTADSDVRIGPSSTLRIAHPVRMFLPVPDDRPPVRPLVFDPPPEFSSRQISSVWVYRPDLGGEHRLEAATVNRPWAAAEVPGWALLVRVDPRRTCDVLRFRPRVYTHRAAGVAEIELASEGVEVPSGTVITVLFLVECFLLAPRLSAETIAAHVRLLAGEVEAGRPLR